MRLFWKVTGSILTIALIGYLVMLLLVFFFQKNMVYLPSRDLSMVPGDAGMAYEKLRLVTSDNIRISAWFIPSPQRRGTVLFCHGNAGNISHRIDSIRIFHDIGLDVLIFDYRGYGSSEGSPGEKGTYLDAEAAWRYLVEEKGTPPEEIVLFGRSLGSAVAAEIALKHGGGLFISESGFTSIPELGASLYPFLPVKLLARYSYDTLRKVQHITLPKLFIHSPDDEIIPYRQGRMLFERAAEPKRFLEIRGGHNEGFILSGELYVHGIEKFIVDFMIQKDHQ